jgi:excisionase family DNA binding protein
VSEPVTRRTYTIKEAAHLLGIGTRLAYELARDGQLPARRLGTRWVVPVAALERFLADVDRPSDGDAR